MNEKLAVEPIVVSAINFSMQQNAVPVVRQLILRNQSQEALEKICVKITSTPTFTKEYTRTIDSVPPQESLDLGAIDIKVSPDYLLSLSERISATFQIQVETSESTLCIKDVPIELLPYNQWAGLAIMPEMLAAFSTPNHPLVARVIANAGNLLEKWTGNPSFTAYQEQNINSVQLQIAAVYGALQKENIMYVQAPPSFEAIGQRIRLCDTILQDKQGNCLDLTLFFATCLESVGLNPMIVCVEGHAFLGCWLEDEYFPEIVLDDSSLLSKRIAEGIHEICIVESTALTAGQSVSFNEAEERAAKNLATMPFDLIIDLRRARGSGIRPLPLLTKKEDGSLDFSKDPLRQDRTHGITQAPQRLSEQQKLLYTTTVAQSNRLQLWERKLLDLSLRNTLLNFRVTRNSIQLLTNQLGVLEDAISSGEEFQLLHKPQDIESTLRDSKIYEAEMSQSILETLMESEFQHNRLRTYLTEGEVASRITFLYRSARTSMEENGANTLFLALGFLRWYETDRSQQPRYAPLILLPVDIVRKTALKGYVVRIRDEEPQINITLLEMLRQDFGLTLQGLDPPPMDDSGVDLDGIFSIFRQAIMDQPRWDIEDLAFLGIFSFGQFIMWNDLRNRSEDLIKNKVVASLIEGRMLWEQEETFPTDDQLDQFSPRDIAVPSSADSSQLKAIYAASANKTFILHGPPGTGKSQTITNIIANALFQGQSVLFVAEKMAALSVVEKRLSDIGLGPFALELHSNKAAKRDVLSQLEETLELGQIKSPDTYEQEASALQSARESLNRVVNEIHKTRAIEISLYDAILEYEKHYEAQGTLLLDSSLVENFSLSAYQEWTTLLERLLVAAQGAGGAKNHPLAEIRVASYTPALQKELYENIQRLQSLLVETSTQQESIAQQIDFPMPTRYAKISSFVSLWEFLSTAPPIPQALYAVGSLHKKSALMVSLCEAGKTRDALAATLLADFSDSILDFSHDIAQNQWNRASAQWFLPRILGQNQVVKMLQPYATQGEKLSKERIPQILEHIREYQHNQEFIKKYDSSLEQWFGSYWNHGSPDFDEIMKIFQSAVTLQELVYAHGETPQDKADLDTLLEQIYFADTTEFQHFYKPSLQELVTAWHKSSAQYKRVQELAVADFTALEHGHWLEDTTALLARWQDHGDLLRDWAIYNRYRNQGVAAHLTAVITALEQGDIPESALMASFHKALFKDIIDTIVFSSQELQHFSGPILENDIARFKELSLEFETLTKKALVAKLSASLPNSQSAVADNSEVGILKRAIRSGGRGTSIRQLFEKVPNLLRRLAPCMLMSPISVAQYLDPSYPPFDLVIFDEASQIQTSDAVGAIARGNNLIVVGDPKQLPPTSFFSTNQLDEHNLEHEDLESILDDCMALSFPETHLLWHYRSRHESLIAFSNREFYNNELYTFPSPNDMVSEVSLTKVDGFYDRSNSRQNKGEAAAIIAEIKRILKDPELRQQSIGVVTFSAAQQTLIEDNLQELFANYPALDEWNSNQQEPIFIKNLENVQGDERDVILFSIGYGPDENGRITMNFGPLNREGGWRRLNVAVSRARRRMVVYSTLEPEQIDLSRTRSQGVASLKSFLEFAKFGTGALHLEPTTKHVTATSVETHVAQCLEDAGYTVKTNVGSSGYRINVAIVDPEAPEEYLLGILIDGETYGKTPTARDRNMLQQNVLASLGWNFYQLWLLDWVHNPQRELENIKKALENAKHHPTLPPTPPAKEVLQLDTLERIPAPSTGNSYEIPYKAYHLPTAPYETEWFYLPETNRYLCSQIKEVLEKEAPMEHTNLTRRIIQSWGMSRLGNRINQRVEDLVLSMNLPITTTKGHRYVWKEGQEPTKYNFYRTPVTEDDRRSLDNIPKEELAVAIRAILEQQISLDFESLNREVSKAFGYARILTNMNDYILSGAQYAVKKEWIVVENHRYIAHS